MKAKVVNLQTLSSNSAPNNVTHKDCKYSCKYMKYGEKYLWATGVKTI